jgi:CRP/FNR family transcriptional regulator, dissimilatory nitrate respiration regulator
MTETEAAADALPALFEVGALIRTLAAGDKLFQTGDRAVAIYKVERGRLRLVRRTVDDRLVVLHTAHAEEFFAEASLFSEAYHCDAVAVVSSHVRVYPKAALLAVFRTDRGLAEAFMARLAHQVQDLRARLELRNIRSARERVLQYLWLRAEADRRSVAIEGPYQDIAAEIGLTREALYRTLARLEAEGVLIRDRSGITLKKSPIA